MSMSYGMEGEPPIIVVGAGRSGTKLLRGILASHPKVVCFPREINYIWRHGNAGFPTDELKPEHARPEVIRYIRDRFERLRAGNSDLRVVEKTCASVLRVDFVHAVWPEAHVIHLIRDGRAVAESARRRWQAPPELGYLWEKVRWVPMSDVPYYALRYLRYQLGRLGADQKAQSSWGPRFVGLDDLVREKRLIEVCGIQWRVCVQVARDAMERLPAGQAVSVRYEDLVAEPVATAQWVFERVGLSFTAETRSYIEREVHRGNLDKWRERLSDHDLELLMPHIESELTYHGYDPGPGFGQAGASTRQQDPEARF